MELSNNKIIDLQTKIGNQKLVNPLLNASGVKCTTLMDLITYISDSSGIITKSCTLNPKKIVI